MRSAIGNSAGRMPTPSMYIRTAGQGPSPTGRNSDAGQLPSGVGIVTAVLDMRPV